MALYAYPRPDGILLGLDRSEGATVRVAKPEAVGRGLELDAEESHAEPLAFVDRCGAYATPWPVGLRLARRVAEVYANAVIAAVAEEECELRYAAVHGRTGSIGRDAYYVSPERGNWQLRERQPILDLVRQWCGREAIERFDEVAALRAEVGRLRRLIEGAAKRFEESGQPDVARRLRKELGG